MKTPDRKYRLTAKQLTITMPRGWIPVKHSTTELSLFRGMIGQDRAMRAIKEGLKIPTRGFNIFAAGEAGAGKTSTLQRIIAERAATETAPQDLCYVHN